MDCAGICHGDAHEDCAGICGGTSSEDAYGTCCEQAEQDCRPICGGNWFNDACNLCLAPDDSTRNNTCRGCDGVPQPDPSKRKRIDACGVCGGDGTSCLDCRSKLFRVRWQQSANGPLTTEPRWMVPLQLDTQTVQEWYDYNGNSDNSFGNGVPDPTRENLLRILAVRDMTGKTFFVATLDAVSSNTAGQAWIQLSSNMSGYPVQLQLRDDPNDIFGYDAENVAGAFGFTWGSHETDGFVLGPCPTQADLCINITLKEARGIVGISPLTWDIQDEALENIIPNHVPVPVRRILQICARCSRHVDCAGIGGGDHTIDQCGICLGENDETRDESCKDCRGIINGGWTRDACEICLAPQNATRNTTCVDCAGKVNGGLVLDECLVCGGDGSGCEPCPKRGYKRHFSVQWLNAPTFTNVKFPPFDVTTVQSFYAFNAATFSSGNPRTRANRQLLTVVNDVLGRHYLVLINSRWAGAGGIGPGGSAGSAKMSVHFAPGSTQSAGTNVAVADEVTFGDLFSFSQMTDSGMFQWAWNADRTDGVALGPLPLDDSCITLRYHNVSGLDAILIAHKDHQGLDREHPIPIFLSPLDGHGPELRICAWCVCPWVDACGVCQGNNSTCAGCDGVPHSKAVEDLCGVCGGDSSSCADCCGVPNGLAIVDVCDVCRKEEEPLSAHNSTCKDCFGHVWGNATVDACRKCRFDNDPWRDKSCLDCRDVIEGGWTLDVCGLCLAPDSSIRDDSCRGCDGVPIPDEDIEWRKVEDECGVCGGDGTTCHICSDPREDVVFHAKFLDCEGDPAFVDAYNFNPGVIVPLTLEDLPGSPQTVQDFYAYVEAVGPGDLFSTNNELDIERSDTTVILLVKEADGHIHLVMIHDKPHDGTGGMVSLAIDSLSVANKGVELQVVDDTSDPRDLVVWNPFTGLGHMRWTWNPCCTDGFALGPLPFESCLALNFTKLLNINNIKIATLVHIPSPPPLVAGLVSNGPGSPPPSKEKALFLIDVPTAMGRPLQLCSCCACDHVDECGVCQGNGDTCPDCRGVPNGGWTEDACGTCRAPDDDTRDDACRDCMGTPQGASTKDQCGICRDPDDPLIDSTCEDCNGEPNGGHLVDACDACKLPDDPTFNRGCEDCRGVFDGTWTLDLCQKCLAPDDPARNTSCADCFNVPNGDAINDPCGVCGGMCMSCCGCDGVPRSGKVLDECGLCKHPDDPTFSEQCRDCNRTIDGPGITDECGLCLALDDPYFNKACVDCRWVPNGGHTFDRCEHCLAPYDPQRDESCKDCSGQVNGPHFPDPCGECKDPLDPTFGQGCAGCNHVPNSGYLFDQCGLCLHPVLNGSIFNISCLDCQGTPFGNATYDECGLCLLLNNTNFNKACAGCDWIPNSGAMLDQCEHCGGNGRSCLDCMGEAFGNATYDSCGVCGGSGLSCADCRNIPNGGWTLDACGVCLPVDDEERDQTCLDCFDVPNGGAVLDVCDECDGDGTSCLGCDGRPFSGRVEDACGVCGGDGRSCEQCSEHCAFYEVRWQHGKQRRTLTAIDVAESQTASEIYDYGSPTPLSANTGREESSTLLLGLTRQEASGRVSMLVIYDKPNDGTGGRVFINMTSDKYAGNPDVQIDVEDDPFSPDAYSWDTASGTGAFYSRWGEADTDGFALGGLPRTKESCLHFDFPDLNPWACTPNPQGIDKVVFLTYNRISETVVRLDAIPPIAFFYGFSLCRVCKCGPGFDPCGLCIEPHAPEHGAQCEDCEGTPNGRKHIDACGVCGGNNGTCEDCNGIPNGFDQVDECGVCGGFGMSCAGCDGVPNSGNEVDACGLCKHPADDPTFNQTCAGCDHKPNSGLVFDLCGICGGNGSSCAGCDGVPNSGWTTDGCGACRGPRDPLRDSECIGCDGVPRSGKTFDECEECLLEDDPRRNKRCAGCDWVPNSGLVFDSCGVCNGDNETCTGCDGDVNSGLIFDICGVCGGNGRSCLGCDQIPFSGKTIDLCGICGGDGQTCAGCDGIPLSGTETDACGLCLSPIDPFFNKSCAGCDQIPNSLFVVDPCGACKSRTDPTWGDSCAGCDGVPDSGHTPDRCGVCRAPDDPERDSSCLDCEDVPRGNAVRDRCGVCDGDGTTCLDCAGEPNGPHLVDQCSQCLLPDNPTFGLTCLDCAGLLNGLTLVDRCGVCGGDGQSCTLSDDILAIIIGGVLVLAIVACVASLIFVQLRQGPPIQAQFNGRTAPLGNRYGKQTWPNNERSLTVAYGTAVEPQSNSLRSRFPLNA